jgi:hypothetical protein
MTKPVGGVRGVQRIFHMDMAPLGRPDSITQDDRSIVGCGAFHPQIDGAPS